MVYAPASNLSGMARSSFAFKVSDSFGSGTVVATMTLNVSAVNDAPTNTVPSATSVNEDAALVISGISIADVDAGTANVSVTLTVASGTLTVSTNVVIGVTSGAIGGNGSSTLTITGSQSAINATLASTSGVTYRGTLNFNGSDVLTVTTNDLGNSGAGGALTDVDTVAITVNAVNDAPINTVPNVQTVNEDVATSIIGISITDVDAASANVSVTLTSATGTNILLTNVSGGVNAGQISGNGTGTVTITAPLANINATLANATGLRFTTASNSTASTTLTVTTNDRGSSGAGGTLIDIDTITINVSAVNDAPTNSVPSTVTATEDVATSITGIAITDVDAGTNIVRVTLAAANGTLAVLTTVGGGVNAGQITGNGAGTVTITAPLANINATLANATGLLFTTAANSTAATSITVTTNDLGNSGTGGALIDVDTINITVTAVNDVPVNTVPASRTATEDVATAITGISITDVDAGPANVSVTLTTASGTLNVNSLVGGGVTSGQITNNGTGTVTITAPLMSINATLANATGLLFTTAANSTAATTVTVTTNDLGNSGTVGALIDVDTIAITVSAVNDGPTNTVPGAQTVNEDTALVISGISIADVDAGSATVSVTLSVASGTLTVSSTAVGGVTSGAISGNGTSTVTLSGSQSAINATLADLTGVTYQGTLNFNGSDVLTVTTNDLGNTGAPGHSPTATRSRSRSVRSTTARPTRCRVLRRSTKTLRW